MRSACGVMVIVIGNGHDQSRPGFGDQSRPGFELV